MQVQFYPVAPHHLLYHLPPPPGSCLGGPPCSFFAAPAFAPPFAVLPAAHPPPPPPPPPHTPQAAVPPPPPHPNAAFYGPPGPAGYGGHLPPLPPPLPPPQQPTPTSPLSGLTLQFQSLTVGAYVDGVYPACHYGQDYASKLLTWLKTHRMHKYFDRLRKYSFEQLLAIDRSTLEAEQFTQGAIKKLLGMVERVRQDRAAFECPSRSSGSPCSSGACSEEELQLHMLRTPPPLHQLHHQHQPLRKPLPPPQPQMVPPLQPHRLLGPLVQPLPPPPPQTLQHPLQQQQQQHQQQQHFLQRHSLRYGGGSS